MIYGLRVIILSGRIKLRSSGKVGVVKRECKENVREEKPLVGIILPRMGKLFVRLNNWLQER